MSALPPEIPERFSKHLIRSERIVVAVRRHPVKMVEPVLSAVAALAVVLWIQTRLSRDVPIIPDVLWLMWLAVLLRALWRLYDWSRDWFVVTDRRLMLNYGVLTRRVAMMPMAKVTDMSFNRSVIGRILGYGEFVLESAGQEQALRSVAWLPNPETLYRLICAELFGTTDDVADIELDLPPVDDLRGPRMPPSAPPAPREAQVWRGFRLGPGGDDDERYDTDVIQVGHFGAPADGAPDDGADQGWDDGARAGGALTDGADQGWDDRERDDQDWDDSIWEDERADDDDDPDAPRQDARVDGPQSEDDDGWDDDGWDDAHPVAGRGAEPSARNLGRRPRRRGVLGLWDRLDPLAGPGPSTPGGRRSERSSWWGRLDPRGWRR